MNIDDEYWWWTNWLPLRGTQSFRWWWRSRLHHLHTRASKTSNCTFNTWPLVSELPALFTLCQLCLPHRIHVHSWLRVWWVHAQFFWFTLGLDKNFFSMTSPWSFSTRKGVFSLFLQSLYIHISSNTKHLISLQSSWVLWKQGRTMKRIKVSTNVYQSAQAFNRRYGKEPGFL